MSEKQRPERQHQSGSIKLVVWNNTIEKNGKTYTIPKYQVTRSYKVDDEWKQNSITIEKHDLDRLRACLNAELQGTVTTTYQESEESKETE